MPDSPLTAETPAVDADGFNDQWQALDQEERVDAFRALDSVRAGDFFLGLETSDRAALIEALSSQEQRVWLRLLPGDEAADLLQAVDDDLRPGLLELLDRNMRAEVEALLIYREDVAGGKMNPRYARVSPEMTAQQALAYLRFQAAEQVPLISYVYVVTGDDTLVGVISFRELILAGPSHRIREVMHTSVVSVPEDLDQEGLAQVLSRNNLLAVPVVDADGRMKGVISIDDVLDVVREEATEDIQKIGGVEALDTPYFQTGFRAMLQKRGGWLSLLFVGEMFTATAMGFFEAEIEKAVILAIFVPLIISSGGNSGSQASTLVIRAMALGEVGVREWWRVARRELVIGLSLGLLLATIGMLRISVWQLGFGAYGSIFPPLAATVGLSLVGVVAWGTLAGCSLPFVLRRAGFDPASASAPFVATAVDVTGLVIYFSVAKLVLLR
ncbi:MAG: magnesium transporter [Dehalococcoidia bacterium]